MTSKYHGHAPRVRRRKNYQTGAEYTGYQVSIDKDAVISNIVASAIGAVVGTAVTRAVFDKKNAR